ncbi:MAG: hypothetical protein WAL61_11795 [Acidimicrobiales bacterium]
MAQRPVLIQQTYDARRQEYDRTLENLAESDEAVRAAMTQLRGDVRQARDLGASWADIGRILGTTRQAAQQRFGS